MSMFPKQEVIITYLDHGDHIPAKHLGGLIAEFQKRFPTFSLFPWFYCANDKRGQYKLMVAKSLDRYGLPTKAPENLEELIDRTDHTEMLQFVRGYAAGLAVVIKDK